MMGVGKRLEIIKLCHILGWMLKQYIKPYSRGNVQLQLTTLAILPTFEHVDFATGDEHHDVLRHVLLPCGIFRQTVVHWVDHFVP